MCDLLPFLKVHYCTCVLRLPLLRMHRFISNFLLPSSSPSIVIQMPMLNCCACYCFQKSNHRFLRSVSGWSQGNFLLQETFLKRPSLISTIIKCMSRWDFAFFILTLSQRPNLMPKDRKKTQIAIPTQVTQVK